MMPPKYPDMRPNNVPMDRDIITTKSPIIMETLDP
jgi:hypothetical protein